MPSGLDLMRGSVANLNVLPSKVHEYISAHFDTGSMHGSGSTKRLRGSSQSGADANVIRGLGACGNWNSEHSRTIAETFEVLL